MEAIWVDTDPGLGLPGVDVDDAVAIHALHAAGLPLAGLSSCFGNTSLRRTHRVATGLGRRLGLPVARGAAAPGDTDTEAVEALLGHSGIVLAIGPLTNVAAALRRGASWTRLIVLGGTTARGPNLRRLRTTELNLAVDLVAARDVLRTDPDLVPMEPCRRVWLRRQHMASMPPWLARGCRSWLALAPVHSRHRAFCPWDLVAAMWLIQPTLFDVSLHRVELVGDPFRRGHVHLGPGSARVVTDVDGPALLDAYLALLTGASP